MLLRPLFLLPTVCLALLAAGCAASGKAELAAAPAPVPYDGTVLCTLQVRDLAAAKKWYADVLGCRVVYELAAHDWAEVSTPTTGTLIGLSQNPEAPGNGGSSFAFGVKDIEAARKALVEHGVEVEGEIMVIPDVVKLLGFSDPDGNALMFYQPLLQEHPAKAAK